MEYYPLHITRCILPVVYRRICSFSSQNMFFQFASLIDSRTKIFDDLNSLVTRSDVSAYRLFHRIMLFQFDLCFEIMF